MLPQPKTIDQFTAMLSAEAARPVAFRDKLANIEGTTNATLERFDAQPLETDLDQVLAAHSTKLAVVATRENFDRIPLENRCKAIADTAAVTHKPAGVAMLEADLGQRTKGRVAKRAAIGKEAAAAQEAAMNPDLPAAEFDALEAKRAALVDQAEQLDLSVANARNAITYFSNETTAESWHAAVLAVRAVNFA